MMTIEDLDQLEASENGHGDSEPITPPVLAGAYVIPERGVFVDSNGEEWELLPIPKTILERLYNQKSGAPTPPKVPMVEVTIGKGHKTKEPNPNDADYKAAVAQYETDLAAFEQERGVRLMMYLLTRGIKGQPPAEFVEDNAPFFPGYSESEMKYIWINSVIPEDDLTPLVEAITGQTAPTAKGLTEAENFTES